MNVEGIHELPRHQRPQTKQRRHRRGPAVGLGMAAGAVLAAALIPVANAPAARADDDGGSITNSGGASVGGGDDLGIGLGRKVDI